MLSADLPRLALNGHGHRYRNAFVFTCEEDSAFGECVIQAGSVCRQFETGKSAWTFWKHPNDSVKVAQEWIGSTLSVTSR
jgi:hypothetical protein